MKLLLLSGRHDAHSVGRLVAAARARGHEARPLDPYACSASFDHTGAVVLERGRPVAGDVVLARLSAKSATPYALGILGQLAVTGLRAPNRPDAVALAADKLRTLQVLAGAGVPVPRTLLLSALPQVPRHLASIGGVPAIVKHRRGSQGIGVMLAESERALASLLAVLFARRRDTIVQRFVRESQGEDVRAFVVGDRVVAAMRRVARPGEFRSNVHRGAAAIGLEPAPELARLAVAATRAVGLAVAGVDLVVAAEGPLVLEVNGAPGVEGIERATGVDVAGAIVELAAAGA